MTIRRVHHVQVTIPSGSEEAGRAFYCGVLGLREIPKPKVLRGRGGFWVSLGNNVDVHIGTEDAPFDRRATKAHVAYEVDDLKSWRARLTKAGIECVDSTPIPGYGRFKFRDPFGNRIELIERFQMPPRE